VIEALLPALPDGGLAPVAAESFPFERAPDADRFVSERRTSESSS